jgi:hypothetical protein
VCKSPCPKYHQNGESRETCSRRCGAILANKRRLRDGRYKPHSPEVRKHISEGLMGHVISDETRKKISDHQKYKGKKMPKWVGEKISKAHKLNPYDTHHVDMNHANDEPSNKLRVTNREHNYIHRSAYIYLLEKFGVEEVHKYLDWLRARGWLSV